MAYKYMERITVGTAPDGHRIRKRIYGNTKTELEANRKRVLLETEEIRHPSEITLGKYAEKWLTTEKAVRSANTQDMYKLAIKKLKPVSSLKLKDVTRTDLQKIVNDHWQHTRSCQMLVMTIKAIFNAAVYDGIITYNPAARIERPKAQRKPRRTFSRSEAAAILAEPMGPMEHIYVLVLYSFGLRPGEACALVPSDFDFSAGVLTVSRSVSWADGSAEIKCTKTGNTRVIPIPDGADRELAAYISTLKGLYLFHKQDGQLMSKSALTCMWRRVLSHINTALGGTEKLTMTEGITQYTFRRTFATDLYYSGISLKKAAQLMGHADTKMIMDVYAQLDDEREDLSALRGRMTDVGQKAGQLSDTGQRVGQIAT